MKTLEKKVLSKKYDEWSLKGKGFTGNMTSWGENENMKPSKYYAKDIETLRKKLIEDIEKYFDEWGSEHYRTIGKGLKWVINKRFGVTE